MKIVPIPDTIPKLYQRRVDLTQDKLAFGFRAVDGTWTLQTWGQFWEEVCKAAAGLRAHGLQRGDRLAILLPTCQRWEVIQQAALLEGAVVIGVDSTAGRDDVRRILQQVPAKFVVIADQKASIVSHPPSDAFTTLAIGDGGILQPSRLAGDCIPKDKVFKPSGRFANAPQSEDIATLIFTSGTTGKARAVEISHGKLMTACAALVDVYEELGANDSTLCWLPMSALFQRMANLLTAACGMQTFFIDDPRSIVSSLLELKPSFLIGVPRFFEKLEVATRQLDASQLHNWTKQLKYMVSGSAPLAPSVLRLLHERGILVLEAYGLSENVVPMAANRAKSYRFGSVGKPLPANEIRFAADGELLVKGPGVFGGYNKESSRNDLFTSDGFYKTGDCGYLDQDGYLYLTGRKSEIIKTSTGRRISPSNVESVYLQSPYIDQLAVVGEGRKYLAALIVVKTDVVDRYLVDRKVLAADHNVIDAEIKRLFLEELARIGESVAPYEQVRTVGLLREPFSVARGEITSSLKLRRQAIAVNYSHLIERLYQEPLPCVLIVWNDSTTCEPQSN